jgi:hypothetical protein
MILPIDVRGRYDHDSTALECQHRGTPFDFTSTSSIKGARRSFTRSPRPAIEPVFDYPYLKDFT